MTDTAAAESAGAAKRIQALHDARRRDSESKRNHVRKTVESMVLARDSVNFASVARRARVSTWLVYADGVREHIQTAMRQQAEEPIPAKNTDTISMAGLRTDLALAREEIKRLRADNDKLRRNAQRLLGQQLDQVNVTELIARVDTLVNENRRLAGQIDQTTIENTALRSRLTELEEDVTAARTALRRMIRTQTSDISAERNPSVPPARS
jgi:predicted nuclease with TOPRIM domain